MNQQAWDNEEIGGDDVLWRYHDLPRYLDLLLNRRLFFSKAGKFEDPFEGLAEKKWSRKIASHVANKDENASDDDQPNTARPIHVTVNSWHLNATENYAMWRIYAQGEYGIAIQSNYERLTHSFTDPSKEIVVAKIKYVDRLPDWDPKDTLAPFLHKRMMYEYEKEVRCCYVIKNDSPIKWEEQDIYDGVFVDVDLDKLIERIYISPYSPRWIKEIVEGVTLKLGLNKEIVHSSVFKAEEY